MSTGDLPRSELLKDSEATLREVAGILTDLGAEEGEIPPELEGGGGSGNGNGASDPVRAMMQELPQLEKMVTIFFRTYREIISVIESIRNGRGILHRAALERVQRTHQKLDEVSTATETAASAMLDGLDRSLNMVDDLVESGVAARSERAASPDPGSDDDEPTPRCTEIRDQLREELHGMVSILQFQDITAQQLSYASGVLKDVEDRLASLVNLFEAHGLISSAPEYDEEREPTVHGTKAFDPAASTEGADDRQALADEIFTMP